MKWRAVGQRALNPEVVMSLHLPSFVDIFSDKIHKCVLLHENLQGPIGLPSVS